jgi:SAM-dependent methyltransferase
MSTVSWIEHDTIRTARWHSENGSPPPARILVVDDHLSAPAALRLARSGTGLLWRGDFGNARQLLHAMARRLPDRCGPSAGAAGPGALFRATRQARSHRAVLLGRILILLEHDRSIRLRRAPDVRAAGDHAYGRPAAGSPRRMLVSLPELLGVIGAYQWHRNGIEIAALGARVHPAYGVFAPTRGDYVDLVARTPFPPGADRPVAWDIGTGTGVLAAVLARRGAREVTATDLNPRAVRCARDNVRRLGLTRRVRVAEADLFPGDRARADLIVCNPPWLPGRPSSGLELGIYDHASGMLNRFLGGLASHLAPQGEGWLILSDLAERLGLRGRDELRCRIADAGLRVVARYQTEPRRARPVAPADPLDRARAGERTVLWRLGRRPGHW